MIKAIIFDCFGVLVGKGFEYTYREAGGDPVQDKDFIENTLGRANLGLIDDNDFRRSMAKRVGTSPQQWSQSIVSAELLNVDLLKYIEQLHVSYKTAILSNANTGVLDRKIGEDWLSRDFDEIVVSADVGIAKPDPRIYYLVVERLGVAAKDCLYVDDRQAFVEVAEELGMRTILYEDFERFKRSLKEILG